ncbi:hypothetical protein JYK14_07700 [Siccirubricoccus sp. KC 17139]|uniref:Phytanoyl-CoA dioxygenase n=1 Tax=Siccirubricoccus soli TaxID=2899147 RepID=A0ABT1D2C1_9PROT|nr:hypothetical protein [Siccirubricoccus soli]MCO6416053.1 hypothetical protein [Siccirubricoccus soli]MCP2682185.1 hypothetical protein [Siccirubricoccus soli]
MLQIADPFPALASRDIDDIFAAMQQDGVAMLRNCIPHTALGAIADFVEQELARNGGEYFCYLGPGPVAGLPLAQLGRSAGFRGVMTGLYERSMRRAAPADDIFQVLRVLSGRSGLRHSYRFHYDAYLITALVPILIPARPRAQRGDLVIYPNLRGVRSSTLTNLAEKALLQNRLVAKPLASPWVQRRMGARDVPMEPGNVYFFWGYRSLHANRPCPPDVVRATALYHFANPHAENSLVRRIEARHQAGLPSAHAPVPQG